MKLFFLLAVTVSVCFPAFSQESNSNEDYTPFLPELRMAVKFSQTLKRGTVLTSEGLEKERNNMKMFAGYKPRTPYSEINIDGPHGPVRLVILKPDTIKAVVINIHGGAWIMGEPENDAQLNDEMAMKCKVAVIGVDYRLAPEYPFPAGLDDCKAVAAWLVKNARKEFGTDKIILSGASAGAHLSALTAIYIRDSLQSIEMVRGLNLMYGVYDLGRTPSMRQIRDTVGILNKKTVNEFFELVFKGWTMEKLQSPYYSPLYANLHGLPPALFTVGGADPLLDDSYFMEDVWRRSGNKTCLAIYPESPHAFNYFPVKIAKLANEKIYDWIKVMIN